MSSEAWIALAFGVIVSLVGFIWRDLKSRVDKVDDKVSESTQAALAEKVRRLEIDYRNLHDFKTHILPEQFKNHGQNFENQVDRIAGDISRRVDRLERKVFNGHKE